MTKKERDFLRRLEEVYREELNKYGKINRWEVYMKLLRDPNTTQEEVNIYGNFIEDFNKIYFFYRIGKYDRLEKYIRILELEDRIINEYYSNN